MFERNTSGPLLEEDFPDSDELAAKIAGGKAAAVAEYGFLPTADNMDLDAEPGVIRKRTQEIPSSDSPHSSPKPPSSRAETARLNGAKGHGPITEEGKARSSQNALKHGLTAEKWNAHLPGETDEDFQIFREGVLEQFDPCGGNQEVLAERIVRLMWRLRGVEVMEAKFFESLENEPGDYKWVNAFASLSRAEVNLDNCLHKNINQLRKLKAEQLATIDRLWAAQSRNQPELRNGASATSRIAVRQQCHRDEPNDSTSTLEAPSSTLIFQNEPKPTDAEAPLPPNTKHPIPNTSSQNEPKSPSDLGPQPLGPSDEAPRHLTHAQRIDIAKALWRTYNDPSTDRDAWDIGKGLTMAVNSLI